MNQFRTTVAFARMSGLCALAAGTRQHVRRNRVARVVRRLVYVASLAVALFAAAGCRGTVMVRADPSSAIVRSPRDPSEVRVAVLRALSVRHFVLETEGPGQIVAAQARRDQMVRVSVQYDGTQYVVGLSAASGYETRTAPDGGILVDDRALRIVRSVRAGIGGEIERADRERAEAARADRAQRDQQMMAAQQAQTYQPTAPEPQTRVDTAGIVTAAAGAFSPFATQAIGNAAPTQGVQSVHRNSQIQSSQTITCCVNGSLFNCPDQSSYQQCISLGQHSCVAAGRCN